MIYACRHKLRNRFLESLQINGGGGDVKSVEVLDIGTTKGREGSDA